MLNLLFTNPYAFVVILGGIILAIGIHEAAHAFMADYLGDPTPRTLGRTTLNPLAHLDPYGTLAIIFTGFFGWGKPTPFDPYNLRNPRRDTALIALAGPASNIVLAVLLSLITKITSMPSQVLVVFYGLVSLNVNLALFNLIPVPPLDGSKLLPTSHPLLKTNSLMLILLLILPIFGGYSVAYLIISPISRLIINFLLP